jgi:hypothetical protein
MGGEGRGGMMTEIFFEILILKCKAKYAVDENFHQKTKILFS